MPELAHLFDGRRRARDPTGTAKLRRAYRAEGKLRMRQARANMRQAVIDMDVLGLGSGNFDMVPRDARLRAFADWLGAVVGRVLLSDSWQYRHISRAWRAGELAAARELATDVANASFAHVDELARIEMMGIAAAVSQKVAREAASVITTYPSRHAAWTRLADAFDSVGPQRISALADVTAVKGFNGGKVAVYKRTGIKRVGVIAERQPGKPILRGSDPNHPHVHDYDPSEPRNELGEWSGGGGSKVATNLTVRAVKAQLENIQAKTTWPYKAEMRYIAWEGKVYTANAAEVTHEQMAEATGAPLHEYDLIRGFIKLKDIDEIKAHGGLHKWINWQYPEHFKLDALPTVVEVVSALAAEAVRIETERNVRSEEIARANYQEDPIEVGIHTAGDDRVCDECDDYAAYAPYDISEVEDALPLHPNCRCTWFPWDDKRFSRDAGWESQPRAAPGEISAHGGEFSSSGAGGAGSARATAEMHSLWHEAKSGKSGALKQYAAVMQKRCNRIAQTMMVDPAKISVATGGTKQSGYGTTLASTDDHTGNVTMFARVCTPDAFAGTLVHELTHVKYKAMRNAYRKEKAEVDALLSHMSEAERAEVQNADGTLKGELAEKYRVYSEYTALWDIPELQKEGGVSDYSKHWWSKTVGTGKYASSAVYETTAEMARIKYETGSLPGGPRHQALYTLMNSVWYQQKPPGFKMIEAAHIDGRDAMVAWLTHDFRPASKAAADLAKVIYDDGDVQWFALHEQAIEDKYDPNEERDQRGRWTEGGGSESESGTGEHPGKGYSASARLIKGVIHTGSVYDAQRALYENRKVELKHIREVSTLVDRLGEAAKKMAEQGIKAPVFNLCNVSIKGTNLFCAESKGIPRIEMPVIRAKKTKEFVKYLKSRGYKTEKSQERADHLRSTQDEIDGAKVAANMTRIDKEGFYKRIVVSRDNYILDGHHTWAGQLGVDARDGSLKGDKNVRVTRVDISITKLLAEANTWTGGKGKKAAGQDALDYNPDQPRADPGVYSAHGGEFTSGGGGAGGGGGEVAPAASTREKQGAKAVGAKKVWTPSASAQDHSHRVNTSISKPALRNSRFRYQTGKLIEEVKQFNVGSYSILTPNATEAVEKLKKKIGESFWQQAALKIKKMGGQNAETKKMIQQANAHGYYPPVEQVNAMASLFSKTATFTAQVKGAAKAEPVKEFGPDILSGKTAQQQSASMVAAQAQGKTFEEWKAGQGIATSPVALASWQEQLKQAPTPTIPIALSAWKKVGTQMGSVSGGMYEGPSGNTWYVKTPKTEDHVNADLLANQLYKLAGVSVANQIKTQLDGKSAVASLVLSNAQTLAQQSGEAKANAQKMLREDFAVDAWLGNRDVVGLEQDNVLVAPSGITRIDFGASLMYRAQGEEKPFGNIVEEITSMRNANINAQSAAVFGPMTGPEIAASIDKVLAIPPSTIMKEVAAHGFPPSLAETLMARRAYLANYKAVLASGEKPPYNEAAGLAKIIAEEKAAGKTQQEKEEVELAAINAAETAEAAKVWVDPESAQPTPATTEGWKPKYPKATAAELEKAKKTGEFYPKPSSVIGKALVESWNAKWSIKANLSPSELEQKVSEYKTTKANIASHEQAAAQSEEKKAAAQAMEAKAAQEIAKAKENAAKTEAKAALGKLAAELGGISESDAKAVDALISLSGVSPQTLVKQFNDYQKQGTTKGMPVSPFEYAMIESYVGSGYTQLNSKLRDGVWDIKTHLFAQAVNKALAKMPTYDKMVKRGMNVNATEIAKWTQPGQIVEHRNFASCGKTSSFTGNLQLHIKPLGTPNSHMRDLGKFNEHEKGGEVLGMARTQFLVDRFEKKGSETHVWVSEVESI